MEPLDQTPQAFPPPLLAPPTFKNRRPWLIVFGILELLIAVMFLGMGLMMLLLPEEALKQAQQGQPPQPMPVRQLMLMVALMYAAIATVWAVTGIGTILAKNWARIVSLVLSYFWLICGVFGMLIWAIILPQTLKTQPNMPHGGLGLVLVFTFVAMGIIFVVVPGIFLVFFHNRNVKATCIAGETYARPSRPALMRILIVIFAITLICVPFNFFIPYPVIVFGVLGWGAIKAGVLCLFLITEGISLWGYLRSDLLGWWVALGASIFWALSTLVTLSRGNLIDLYGRMGFDTARMAPFQSHSFLALTWIFGLLFAAGKLLAVIYSKRYFPTTPPLYSEPAI
jgi:hypothetical protein